MKRGDRGLAQMQASIEDMIHELRKMVFFTLAYGWEIKAAAEEAVQAFRAGEIGRDRATAILTELQEELDRRMGEPVIVRER